ncbi:MAG: LPS export ABC transporter ATP-binding protein [Thermodesulfobacteriota bacterium]
MRLSAQSLFKSYKGREVVKGISFTIERGSVVGLLGPNGAGKTTTFYMIVGLVKPDKGKVFIGDEDITDLPINVRVKKGMGYLAQEPSVFRKLSVEDNILAILELLNLSRDEERLRLDALLKELGLLTVVKSKGYSLSGGERRRVEIARTLVNEPSFLLLDEPFTGVDPIAISDIQKIVMRLKAKGIGVLITDHNVREALTICDEAYIIYDGNILDHGTPSEIAKSRKARDVYLGDKFRL